MMGGKDHSSFTICRNKENIFGPKDMPPEAVGKARGSCKILKMGYKAFCMPSCTPALE